ncbi:MAG: glycosyltransferase, partial [Nitrospirota bacterium]
YRGFGHRMVTLIGSYPTKEMIRHTNERPYAKEKTVLGRIGSIYQDNGIEEIIKGFKLISPKNNGVELLLAGRVFDSYKDTFARIMNGLESRVKVSGAFDSREMPTLYSQIDVSIIIYHRSAWFKNITPTKFFDSLAVGVPVIASDMGGLREIIEQYQCGIVVDERNSEEVAQAITMMCQNPTLRHEMGLNGLRAIEERYNWEHMKERLLKIYGTLLQ